jgi:hypothetical protein
MEEMRSKIKKVNTENIEFFLAPILQGKTIFRKKIAFSFALN